METESNAAQDETMIAVTHIDLQALSEKFHSELSDLRTQIGILQARAASLEAQLAKIEPMVEARASRTEKLIAEMQGDMNKLSKAIASKETTETTQYTNIEKMLKQILERADGL